MISHFDYIIIGQGVAGSVLAYTLIEQGKNIAVLDNPQKNTASKVAAGILNPVTGRRLAKSWLIDDLLPFANIFYRNIETQTNTHFYHNRPILRVFESIREQNDFLSKSGEDNYKQYLKETDKKYPYIINDLGLGEITKGGYLEMIPFLREMRQFINQNATLLECQVDYSKIQVANNNDAYDNHNFEVEGLGKKLKGEKLVFCDGTQMLDNPFFKDLPMKASKGEFLLIKSINLSRDLLIKKGVMIVPTVPGGKKYKSKDLFWVGATYDNFDLTHSSTQKAKEYLTDKLSKALNDKVEYEIIDMGFGFRPTIKDRRPIIGKHPQNPNLILFNGMGSKGVLLAPFFAKQLYQHLENNNPLNPMVDLKRFC